MTYVRDWETLEEAVDRIKQSGIEESVARRDLCNAIADRKITLRAMVSEMDYYSGGELKGDQIGVPRHLSPADFDWSKSLPRKSWEGGRYPEDIDWGKRAFSLLETSTQDTIRVFSISQLPSPSYMTELPGRPSSKQLIEVEFVRRREEGLIAGSLKGEAEYLEHWLAATHPKAPRAKASSIENQIRVLYNVAKTTK